MNSSMKELRLNEMEQVAAGEVVTPTKDQMECVGKIIKWIKDLFD